MAGPLFSALTIFLNLIRPWTFMASSLPYLPPTILSFLRAGDFRSLASWSAIKAAWFGRFWSWAGPQVRTGCESRVIPLLQGRVHAGHITAEPYAPPISGTVLEVGAGTGTWVSVYAGFVGRSPRGGGPAVTRVLGVEPNAASQVALREAVAASGLEGVYEPVPCGIEHLAATGAVERGSVDCIVVNLVLCGIPEPQHNIKELYSYLKPGGRIYVHEHVAVNRGVAMWLYQAFVNLFWPICLGGCNLRRNTGNWLREAGSWTSVDLATPADEMRIAWGVRRVEGSDGKWTGYFLLDEDNGILVLQ